MAISVLTPGHAEAASSEKHVHSLVENLATSGQASFSHSQGVLQWILEQSFQQGDVPCAAETYKRERLDLIATESDRLWDRYVRRKFHLGSLNRITIKPGAKPNLYIMHSVMISEIPDSYTVTILRGTVISR